MGEGGAGWSEAEQEESEERGGGENGHSDPGQGLTPPHTVSHTTEKEGQRHLCLARFH
jgi:hypothetical protein